MKTKTFSRLIASAAGFALAVGLLTAPHSVDAQTITMYTKTVTATGTSAATTFTQPVFEVQVANDGASDAYVSYAGAASSSDTASATLKTCETGTWFFPTTGASIKSINLASGSSATVRVTAFTISNYQLQSIFSPGDRQPFFTKAMHCTVASGNESITGALSVTGNTTLGGTLTQNGPSGATAGCGWTTEQLTLSTGGTTTDTTGNLLPANSLILFVVGRVTTTITSACTGWELGDATTAARFTANDTTLTANETQVGMAQMFGVVSTTAAGPTQASAAKVRVTCAGGNPGAGVIRIGVYACTGVGPTS